MRIMYKNKKVLGVITARGGSKGIPKKNIKKLAGKPLITYTIDATLDSTLLTRCIVSTDDLTIAQIAEENGAEIPFIRPSELAEDDSKGIDVIIHALKWLKDRGEEYDYVMILQPTSPLRTSQDIDNCIRKIVDFNADSIMSMYELSDFSIEKLKKIKGDIIIPWFKEEDKESQQRQKLEKVYKRNAAIYITRTNLIMEGDLFGEVSRPYIMPEERSIDINRMLDFQLTEFFLKNSKK